MSGSSSGRRWRFSSDEGIEGAIEEKSELDLWRVIFLNSSLEFEDSPSSEDFSARGTSANIFFVLVSSGRVTA